jgi:hypothetical protein
MDETMTPSLRGWAPAWIEWRDAEPWVSWCYLGEAPLREPFYDLTIQKELQRPFNSLFTHRTDLCVAARWHEESPGLEPSGFIFHMSRCGSTLVSRMLAALPGHLVVSEAGPLDALARSHARAPLASIERRIAWFRWMVSALGQRRTGAEERYFIKFDSRTTLDLPFIREAFPEVPWIFVYRDPAEVLASHRHDPAVSMIPGMIGSGGLELPPDELLAISPAEYGARVLGRLCEKACGNLRESGLPVNYAQLPEAVGQEIARHFGLGFTAGELARMNEAALFHAKHPRRRFQPDGEDKRRELPAEAREAAARWIEPHYAELEQLRAAYSMKY